MSNEMKDWLADNRVEKLMQDNAVLYEALRLAAISYADDFDPLGTTKMHLWIEQAQRNLLQ
ncbi:MAG: hypothetical protein IKB70_07995 [Bacilli bacterium]|nr:hypothetical protein [Bacilli bacterium]